MKVKYTFDSKNQEWIKIFSEDRGIILGFKYYDARPVNEFDNFVRPSIIYDSEAEVLNDNFNELYDLVREFQKERHTKKDSNNLLERIRCLEEKVIGCFQSNHRIQLKKSEKENVPLMQYEDTKKIIKKEPKKEVIAYHSR